MKYFDITPLISEKMAVFPGDVSFRREISMDFTKGDHLLLSAITSTLHLGAHADSPSHYHAKGVGIDQCSLEPYIGPCQVIDVSSVRGDRIQLSDIQGKEIRAPRVLFHSNTFPNPDQWNNDFCGFSPDVIEWLADQGVVLVGIDTPSVDPADSKKLESHAAIYRRGLRVLEGLVLTTVPEGIYTLVALPLKLKGADASPVRAILIDGPI